MRSEHFTVAAQILRGCRTTAALLAAAALALLFCGAYGLLVEPTWLRVRAIRIAQSPTLRIVHISDIHHKGDRSYLRRVVGRINAIDADLVCFTGDLVEDVRHLPDCLDILSAIKKPLFGVPGNHDYWGPTQEAQIRRAFQQTGGDWLVETNVVMKGTRIVGSSGRAAREPLDCPDSSGKRILITHYPDTINDIPAGAFDLILAGHTHGGQVRFPLLDEPLLRNSATLQDRGLSQTPAGPLHVNPGIGTFLIPVRFGCRPEITVISF